MRTPSTSLSLIAALFASCTAMLISGCAGPWASHYRGGKAPATLATTISIKRVSWLNIYQELVAEAPRSGMTRLGASEFTLSEPESEASLRAAAADIGATLVIYGVSDPVNSEYQSQILAPATQTTRTTLTDSSGSTTSSTTATSSTTRWEQRTIGGSSIAYRHVAIFYREVR